jgi:hypothetical protein
MTWVQTTWFGGASTSDSPGAVKRGALARTESGAAFAHPARVRRAEDGRVEGEWFDDGTRKGLLEREPRKDGHGEWRPFVGQRIPDALMAAIDERTAERGP